MAGGGLVRMKGGGGGVTQNSRQFEGGGGHRKYANSHLLFNNWFSVKIKTNTNFIVKILIPITVTISRERCPNNPRLITCILPADHHSRHEISAADPNVVSLIRLLVTMTNNSSNLLQL